MDKQFSPWHFNLGASNYTGTFSAFKNEMQHSPLSCAPQTFPFVFEKAEVEQQRKKLEINQTRLVHFAEWTDKKE